MAKQTRGTASPNGLDGVKGNEFGRSTNYITKKGLTGNEEFVFMPPGMDLNDQSLGSDVRDLPYKSIVDVNGYDK